MIFNSFFKYRHFLSAPCDSERPEEIRNGFVRYHGVRHGDKAKYRCNTGYKLVGDTFMTCSYGKWVGKETPYCDPGRLEFL